MSAQDYPITFGYGATDGDYYYTPTASHPKGANWIGNYHRGDDRAMPTGTPVLVNGVKIGLSGSGNGRYGAHLHVGKFVGGSDRNPNGGGFSLEGATVIAVVDNYGSDPVNAKYVRIQESSGAQWVYLHMSEVSVKVGQVLQGGNVNVTPDLNGGDMTNVWGIFDGHNPTKADTDHWLTDQRGNWKLLVYEKLMPQMSQAKSRIKELEAQLASKSEYVEAGAIDGITRYNKK